MQNAQNTPDSPVHGTPSNARIQQSHAATASSIPRPSPAVSSVDVRAKQQQAFGQTAAADAGQLYSGAMVPGQGSTGPALPAGPLAPHTTSTSSFTVRAHGPFSPEPVKELEPQSQDSQQHWHQAQPQRQGPLQQQRSLHTPPAPTAFGSWGPPPPLATASTAPAAAPAVPAGLPLSAGTESGSGVAKPQTLPAPAPSSQNSESVPLQPIVSAAKDPAADKVLGGTALTSNKQSASEHEQAISGADKSPAVGNGNAGAVVAADDAPDTTAAAAFESTAAVSRSNGSSSQEIRSQQAAQSAPAADAVAAALRAALQEQQQQQQDHVPVPDGSTATHQVNSPEGASAAAAAAAASGSASNSVAAGSDPQLMRLVDTLRKRLDQVKAENQQLEDLLHTAEQATAAEQQRAQQLAADLSSMHRAQDDIVSSAAANAAAQDARIVKLQQDLEASSRQVAALQGALEAIQEQHQQVLSSKDSIEGGALEGTMNKQTLGTLRLNSQFSRFASRLNTGYWW